MTTVTLINPFSGATVKRNITGLSQLALDALPLDEDVCSLLARRIAPCSPEEFLAAYVDEVGSEAAGIVIIGS